MFDEYTIKFAGLKNGKHEFLYNINETFFVNYEKSEISTSNIKITVVLEKNPNTIILHFYIKGHAILECDRCLDLYEQDIEGSYTIYIQFGQNRQEVDENLIYLHENDDKINIAQYIYEFTHLLLPIKRTHANYEDCNKEVTKYIQSDDETIQNYNANWDILKEIKFN